MRLSFIGGSGEVTGSSHMFETAAGRMIIDCGMFQGHRVEADQKNRLFPYRPTDLHSVILSHAHLDHSGRLPLLHQLGFNGNIYTTPASRDLAAIMLRDSAHIQQADVDFLNKKRARNGDEPVPPLYSLADATRILRHFVSIDYHRRFLPLPDVTATLYDAGHILGSALIRLEVNNHGVPFSIGYACDLGRNHMPILRDPEPLVTGSKRLDVLLIESTYGGRHHDAPEDMKTELEGLVNRVVARGGKLIIPAFSVGRTQLLLYYLHQLFTEKRISAVPVYVDSPLSVNATDVFRMHPECYDEEANQLLEQGPVFTYEAVHYVKSLAESKALNNRRKPAIIISASGMCEAGRILHHLKNNITKAKNAVALVGFMAENTLGRRLVERQPKVRIFGDFYPVRCEIATLNGLSAHADHDGVLNYIDTVATPDTRIFLIHGETPGAAAISSALAAKGYRNVTIPQPNTHVDLI